MSTPTIEKTVTTGLYINGEEIKTDDTLTVVEPANPDWVVGHAAAASPEHVRRAIESAKAAYALWSKKSPQERAALMEEAIQGADVERDADAEILSRENGKIRMEAFFDVSPEPRWYEALTHADAVDKATVLDTTAEIPTRTTVHYKPLGVVSLIIPFNWPLGILMAQLPQALLTGNTVIVKPPPSAPLATTRVVQRIAEKLPPGVLNIITGRDADLSELIQSRDVAKVAFTGSVSGGKKIQELAAKTLTRTLLELGGNDAALILDDADLSDTYLDRLYQGVFTTTGQVCMNAKRLYVHRSRVDEVVDGLVKRLEQARLGHGLDPEATMGPLHSPKQKEFVEEIVAEAKASGATVIEPVELPSDPELARGNFARPAIVVDPDRTLRVVTEEPFGPVVPVIPVDSDEDALAEANNSDVGLCGSVWSADIERAQKLAEQIETGYVWINDHGPLRLDLRAPFGGVKQSGVGREGGKAGIRAFQDVRAVAVLDESRM